MAMMPLIARFVWLYEATTSPSTSALASLRSLALACSFQKWRTDYHWLTNSLTNNPPRKSALKSAKVRLVLEGIVNGLDIHIYLSGFHLRSHGHKHRSWPTYSLSLCTIYDLEISYARDDLRTFNPFVRVCVAIRDIRIARSYAI